MATSKTLTPTNVTIQIPAFTDKPDQRLNSNCIDKEADAINALADQMANLLHYKDLSKTTDNVGTFTITSSDLGVNNFIIFECSIMTSGGVFFLMHGRDNEYMLVDYNLNTRPSQAVDIRVRYFVK